MPPNLVSREHLERYILLGSSFCFISFWRRASWNSDCVTRHLVLLRTLRYLFTCRLPERFASDFDFLAEAFGHKWLLSPSSVVACGAWCVIPICAPTWFRRPPNKGSKVVPSSKEHVRLSGKCRGERHWWDVNRTFQGQQPPSAADVPGRQFSLLRTSRGPQGIHEGRHGNVAVCNKLLNAQQQLKLVIALVRAPLQDACQHSGNFRAARALETRLNGKWPGEACVLSQEVTVASALKAEDKLVFDSFSLFLLMLANKTHTSQAVRFRADLRAFRASILPYPAQLTFPIGQMCAFQAGFPQSQGSSKLAKRGKASRIPRFRQACNAPEERAGCSVQHALWMGFLIYKAKGLSWEGL